MARIQRVQTEQQWPPGAANQEKACVRLDLKSKCGLERMPVFRSSFPAHAVDSKVILT
eukprot:COSAG06_NODE_1611_length_8936_cov_2.495078_2_plen_58_part_00